MSEGLHLGAKRLGSQFHWNQFERVRSPMIGSGSEILEVDETHAKRAGGHRAEPASETSSR